MDHLEVHLEFRILVLEGVVAMGGRDKDLLHAMVDKGLDVFLGQRLEELLIAGLADALSAAVLLRAQYPEIYPCLIEDLGRGLGYLLQSRVIAEVAAGEIEDIHPFGEGFYGETLCPVGPGFPVFIEGVALSGKA